MSGVDLIEAVRDQDALDGNDGLVEPCWTHPGCLTVDNDPAGQGPFPFGRRQLLVAGRADVVILPVEQWEGVLGLVAFGLDRDQLVLAGGGAGLADVVVDDRLTGLIEEAAGRQLAGIGAVALDEEVADAKEVVHHGPVISLADRDVGLVLVVLQVGVELTEVLVLQGIIGIDVVQARGQVVIEGRSRDDLVLTDRRHPVGRSPAQPLVEPAVTVGGDRLVLPPGQHLVGEVPLVGEGGVDGVETGVEQDDCQ